jgi:hypothetical protein
MPKFSQFFWSKEWQNLLKEKLWLSILILYKCTLWMGMGVQVFGGFRSISIPLNCFMMKLEILQTESRYVCLYASFNLGYVLTAHTWDANKMTQSFVYCRFFKLLSLNYYCALELLFLLNSCIYRALSKQNVQGLKKSSATHTKDSCE